MKPSTPKAVEVVTGTCPFCGFEYLGSPTQCRRCGTLQERAREEIREEGSRARRHFRFQRALSDLFFLIGLLLGGPMMTLGGELRLGLLLVLAGGFASVLRRYTKWSTPGTAGIGVLAATLVAMILVDGDYEEPLDDGVAEEARLAYARALDEGDPDVLVETRGLGAVTLWFHPPQATIGECGSYPEAEVRDHLAELGFSRVVVVDRNESGGMCSFRP
jgi:hypothetical protein